GSSSRDFWVDQTVCRGSVFWPRRCVGAAGIFWLSAAPAVPIPSWRPSPRSRPGSCTQPPHISQRGARPNLPPLPPFSPTPLLRTGFAYEPPSELPRHGLYHPDLPPGASLADWLARHDLARPAVGLLFYRSHWMSGNLAFIDALVREIERRGGDALPIFTSSL